MKRIYVVTEGQAETMFVKHVLYPFFYEYEKEVIPTTVLTKTDESRGRMYKGGISCFSKADKTIKLDIGYAIKDTDVFVTTMFDFYGLPKDTPGFEVAMQKKDPYEKVANIESAMQDFEKPIRPFYFPYIQLHEFEALIFSDIQRLEEEYFDFDLKPLKDCMRHNPNPELINNGLKTAPSKRIISCIPTYDKVASGVAVLRKIGVERLCQKCKHFSEWIEKLKSL